MTNFKDWLRLVEDVDLRNTNSLGQPIAHSPTALRNFWTWFGRSKVVDRERRPLVVYHGTKADFRAFDPKRSSKQGGIPIDYHPSYFFSSLPDVAQTYAGQETHDWYLDNAHWEEYRRLVTSDDPKDVKAAFAMFRQYAKPNIKTWGEGGNVMPVYLRMLKPLRASGRGYSWHEIEYDGDYIATRDLIEIALDKGHDGIIVRNLHDRREGKGKPSTVYAVFSPNQIKSAIGNRGMFGSNTDMIDESRRRKIPATLFHATYAHHLSSILEHGLGATQSKNFEVSRSGVVYLSDDPDSAQDYAVNGLLMAHPDRAPLSGAEIVILAVNTAMLNQRLLSSDVNHERDVYGGESFEYRGVISPSALSVYAQQ